MFLQSRVDLGSSLETTEDLLMEFHEFQIRAKVNMCLSCDCHVTVQSIFDWLSVADDCHVTIGCLLV